ncbi:hypothetical protein O181_096360 [Austropuccinia psidii MF-1]|uniref:Uncharacterized protein n=1 Tax=Austropuccinia psidii MF-1 TaxID=1389203 RepID=A0A9Q3J7G6_9BASI|nr:hypothetical protein [Austropuccinia psidii MF-1]
MAPLDHTPSVHQLSANLQRGQPMEGEAPFRRGGVNSRRSRSFSGLLGGYQSISQGPRGGLGEVEIKRGRSLRKRRSLRKLKSKLPWKVALRLLKLQIYPIIINLLYLNLNQIFSSRKAPEFKTPSMKAPDSFNGTQAHKFIRLNQSCQFIFHFYPDDFFSDRKKVLHSTSFGTGRAGKWIEPYLSNISNEDPSYLLNNWQLFEMQLFTLFGDINEGRKSEQELENSRMKES